MKKKIYIKGGGCDYPMDYNSLIKAVRSNQKVVIIKQEKTDEVPELVTWIVSPTEEDLKVGDLVNTDFVDDFIIAIDQIKDNTE